MAASSLFPQDSNSKRLLIAFVVTTLFMVLEAIGGWLSGSLALLADAGHMLTDSAALFIALMAVHFSQRKPDSRHTFGYLRLTTLAAFVNAAALVLIVILIVWEAVQRFVSPHEVMGGPMLIIAIAGLLANIFCFWILHRGGEDKNINVRAAALHVLGDLLGSVGAIVAAIVILTTGWTPIDPILSVLVSALVLRSAWRLLEESFHELLEGAPQEIDIAKLRKDLCADIYEVRDVHHVHLWQVGDQRLMTLHVQVIPPRDNDELLQRIQHHLLHHYNIGHATIQMEYQGCATPDCSINQAAPVGEHHHHHH
ncbi:Zinc transporter zitB [Yersinia mollaretii ATCC 43969]|uniref:Zinc transporter zitB n=1 Tax=Yersinia mollaretii (strain ATCC 43969 / DSM 18520 / CIP 103324 / CNY 7263 / WAIP 204) TaxID=349967 RepID=A0ABM9Y5I7_YERMW|nr:CDF family zinc transporter ZitB [Yersinia mollaretii]EEQ09029.1 Zinc transporter zitB [Yersinia mollaretii ATCC 43969]QKJ03593.1 CDF family zinc transporter ZitB [Yersinia mollaretii ATCC 43969]